MPRNVQRLLLISSLYLAVGAASAQSWPTKTVTIVVPFPAGGTTDVLARAVGTKLSAVIGQSVIVDNKPGAGATLGAEFVSKASADGHTLLMGAIHHTVATNVYKNLRYNFEKDFAPITTVALVPNVLTVSTKSTYNSVKDIVTAAKAAPEKVAYGSNGNGTAQHMIGTQFQMETGTKILHVPYKGSAPLTTDLLGGQVDMSFDTITPVLPFIKEGKLRALAVTTAKRSSALPNVPTLQEAGVPNVAIGTWFGLLAPAATPKAVVTRLNTELV
ncbi:MAG: Bug family tripartite tricarboxylate transporter substrate binding protein, partial [Hylemonella sp.]